MHESISDRAKAAAAAGAIAAPVLTAAAGTLTWMLATTTAWEAWVAADALAVGLGAVGTVAGLRFLVGLLASLASLARGREAPAWTGRLARAAAVTLLATLAGAGAAQASDEAPSAGWLPADPVTAPSRQTIAAPAAGIGWTSPLGSSPPAAVRRPAADAFAETTPTASPSSAAREAPPVIRTVRAGESLWEITGDLLGADATDADIARSWPALYSANRGTIGRDPDLILVGMELTVPPALTGDGS